MAQYSKSILASLVLAAAFNFSAQADVTPKIETNPMDEHALGNEWWVNHKSQADIFESSILDDAAIRGKLDVVEYLLSLETETRKWPAEQLAHAMEDSVVFQKHAVLKVLIEKKADALTTKVRNSILQQEAWEGELENVKLLHEAGGDINSDSDRALCFSAQGGELAVVKYLMENGAQITNHACVSAEGPLGALAEAVIEGHMPVVQYMVEEQHAAVNIEGKDGAQYSPVLAEAFYHGKTDMAEFLFNHGATSVGPDNGEGPLAIAVRKGDWDMVRVGLSHGMTLTNTYRHFSQHADIYAKPLAKMTQFMDENNISLPPAIPVSSTLRP